MKNILLFIMMISIQLSLSKFKKHVLCSYTCYFLNFFNHNERFLLELEKNNDYITIENLMNYGNALQTHSNVIMIFLDDYLNYNRKMFPFTLITLNMYLNNVSDSLNMIAQNEDDEKNDAKKLFEGYKIIHFAVKNQLKSFINKYCENLEFYHYQVSYNSPMVENEYTTTNLININNEIKDGILNYYNFIIEENLYNKFHPKNILFYDIMTQQILSNKNNTIKIDNSQHIELNLLRFTPLNVKCSNGTRLTIQDVFQYMKYDFNSMDVLPYIELVISATFRPLAILIRNFFTLIQVASSDNFDSVTVWLKRQFIEMGQQTIKHVMKFMTLPSYQYKKTFLQRDVLGHLVKAIKNYIKKPRLSKIDIEYNNLLLKVLSNFFIKNKLYFTSDIVLTNKNITMNNADAIKNQLENIIKKVDIYMKDLEKWSTDFNFIVQKFKIRYFNVSNFKKFIDFKVLDRICNSEARSEIYNASMNDSNNINIGYYEDMKIVEHNLKDLKDDHNENDEDTKNSFQYELTYEPLYMIDYLPYNV
ncbi:uncharacterized protein LOC126899608 isoform X1 [Daktulosphaira vitifoliae]|uniref:uncharacterized protein LOC126899608 isoform X1 n=2 Tax=Daktulosphaira vitifoliae TaxID=58002 RepID=UPI0021A99777|nr:uncharacterized protein LOC126899608 isoform X1 [Daktulosphaira vitifoliae]